MGKLIGKTAVITGGSRGIGAAIARRLAKEGANIALLAKTTTPHPKLPGTIHTVAEEVEAAGGIALPIKTDIRFEKQLLNAIQQTTETFGGIDFLINNASAIFPFPTEHMEMKKYDLMMECNMRATFLASKLCIPFLKKSEDGRILNLSPPLNLDPKWFKDYLAYTMSKYGMSMCTLGMAAEFPSLKINSLWPKTTIQTSAVKTFFAESYPKSRTPDIMADAAFALLSKEYGSCNFYIDEDVMKREGVDDFSSYGPASSQLQPDLFLD